MQDITWVDLFQMGIRSPQDLERSLNLIARRAGYDLLCAIRPPANGRDGSILDANNSQNAQAEFSLVGCNGERIGTIKGGRLHLDSVPRQAITAFHRWRFSFGTSSHELAFVGGASNLHCKDDLVIEAASLVNQTLSFLIGQQQAHIRGLIDGLSTASAPAVLINANGQIEIATPCALKLFSSDFGIKEGRLWSAHSESDAELCGLTSNAGKGPDSDSARSFVVHRTNSPSVLVRPLPLHSFATGLFTEPWTLVYLTASGHTDVIEEEDLRVLFGLSQAEAQIARLLGEGLEPQQVAKRRQVSVGTVRVQMKRVFQKVRVHRQAQLIKVIAELRSPVAIS